MESSLWTEKYAPRGSREVVGQNKAVQELAAFVASYRRQKKKAALLYGPAGTGKTCSAYAVAREHELEVVEINASDVRNKDAIERVVGSAMKQHSLTSKGKLILIDEVDGLSGTKDRGGLPALLKLMQYSAFPVVMTIADPWDVKFSSLRSKTVMIQYHHLAYTSIASILKRICKTEGIEYEEEALTSLSRSAGGDARAATNDLFTLTAATKKLEKSRLAELLERDMTDTIINALVKVFKTKDETIALAAFDNVQEDPQRVMLFLDENIPSEYRKPEDLCRAYEALSRADVFAGRIRRMQHWRFLVYVNALTSAAIALAKDEKYPGFTAYKQPSRILRIWQQNMKWQKRNDISKKIAMHTHCSQRVARKDIFPFLHVVFRKNKTAANAITRELDLSDDEAAWLKK